MNVAIIGLSPSTHPNGKPFPGWLTWGLAWDAYAPRYDALFEMHDRALWEKRGPDYLKRLQELDALPVWMQAHQDEVPTSQGYPFTAVLALLGRDYIGSSIAYMVAKAVLDGAARIGLWGVDLSDEGAYGHQRPNLEYILGIAHGRGIRIEIAEPTALLHHRPTDMFLDEAVIYPRRYGQLA